jgi:hypothetical protein
MRVALLITFAASRKEPLGEMLQRVNEAFTAAGLNEPRIGFNFGDSRSPAAFRALTGC